MNKEQFVYAIVRDIFTFDIDCCVSQHVLAMYSDELEAKYHLIEMLKDKYQEFADVDLNTLDEFLEIHKWDFPYKTADIPYVKKFQLN